MPINILFILLLFKNMLFITLFVFSLSFSVLWIKLVQVYNRANLPSKLSNIKSEDTYTNTWDDEVYHTNYHKTICGESHSFIEKLFNCDTDAFTPFFNLSSFNWRPSEHQSWDNWNASTVLNFIAHPNWLYKEEYFGCSCLVQSFNTNVTIKSVFNSVFAFIIINNLFIKITIFIPILHVSHSNTCACFHIFLYYIADLMCIDFPLCSQFYILAWSKSYFRVGSQSHFLAVFQSHILDESQPKCRPSKKWRRNWNETWVQCK